MKKKDNKITQSSRIFDKNTSFNTIQESSLLYERKISPKSIDYTRL